MLLKAVNVGLTLEKINWKGGDHHINSVKEVARRKGNPHPEEHHFSVKTSLGSGGSSGNASVDYVDIFPVFGPWYGHWWMAILGQV